MARQFKCVVFDVDGTLLDTSEGIISAVKYTINKFGLTQIDEETIKSFIGPPIQNSFKRIYKLEDNETLEIASTFRKVYKDEYLLLAKPYCGIFEVFDYLNTCGIKTAIATYKREDYALKLLRFYGFDRYTDSICGSDFEGKLRKNDIIEKALRKSKVFDFSQSLMIGDSDNDAIGSSEIGMKFLGVTYGFGFKTQKDVLQYDAIGSADITNEIIDIIREYSYED